MTVPIRRRMLPVFLGGVLLLAGCGGGDRDGSVFSAPGRWFRRMQSRREQAREKEDRAELDAARRRARVARGTGGPSYDDAVARVRRRDYNGALKVLDSLIERGRRSPKIFSLKGDCHHQRSEFEQAIFAYRQALRMDKRFYTALRGIGFSEYNLGNRHRQAGRLQEAVENYRSALEHLRAATGILPGDADVAYARALSAEALGSFFAKRARTLGEIKDPQGAETNADKALKLFDEALEAATFYVHRKPTLAAPRILMGRLYMRKADLRYLFGASAQAKTELNRAAITWQSILKDIDPKHEFAREKLDECKRIMEEWLSREKPLRPEGDQPLPR